jgi:hypothetical protein
MIVLYKITPFKPKLFLVKFARAVFFRVLFKYIPYIVLTNCDLNCYYFRKFYH